MGKPVGGLVGEVSSESSVVATLLVLAVEEETVDDPPGDGVGTFVGAAVGIKSVFHTKSS